jgi:hypothetical protein
MIIKPINDLPRCPVCLFLCADTVTLKVHMHHGCTRLERGPLARG